MPRVLTGARDMRFPCVMEGAKLLANGVLEDPARAGRLPRRGIRDIRLVREYRVEKVKGYL